MNRKVDLPLLFPPLTFAAYKIAVVDFGKAIALRPNRAENYFFRGSCQCKLGNFERVVIHRLIISFSVCVFPLLSGNIRLHDC